MQRKITDETNPADWFLFAAERLRSADHLWEADGLTSVERYLKGFLIAKGWRLVKTQDLKLLMENATKMDARFKCFEQFAVGLTADFFAQHYPGSDLANIGTNYETYRRQTGELIELIRQNLPGHFPAQ